MLSPAATMGHGACGTARAQRTAGAAYAGSFFALGGTVLGWRVTLITRSHVWPCGSICRGEFLTIAPIGMYTSRLLRIPTEKAV